MNYIYIGFSTPAKFSLISTVIKFWQKAKYSHVYIRFESSSKYIPSSVYQADARRVNFRSLQNFSKDNKIVSELKIEITPEERQMLLGDCINLAGSSYGYCELLKIIINDITFKLFKKTFTFKDAPEGYICSELVARLLTDSLGFRFTFTKPLYLLTPKDIFLTISENNKETQ